ncbi:adenylyl-sulfate kinase [Euzebya tangerina]|uniref:adenylyl-sulfate kinase n=1 Tax=Euzebya tangerina TaxID=591198 RepID=UPI00196B1301|nr:adenylyl-sulfate kinase [Euzebya tangerina]
MTAPAATWPDVVLSATEIASLELLARGLLAPLETFMGQVEVEATQAGDPLPDGSLVPVPVVLASRGHEVGTTVALRTPEGDLLAGLTITEVFEAAVAEAAEVEAAASGDGGLQQLASGPLIAPVVPTHYDLTEHRLQEELPVDDELAVVIADRPLDTAQLRSLTHPWHALVGDRLGGPDQVSTATLVRSLEAAGAASVTVIPQPPGDRVAPWAAVLSANLGRSLTTARPTGEAGRIEDADLAAHLGRRQLPRVDAAETPLWPPAVAEVLEQEFPPPGRVGFTVFFTGLSGSGKSTVAAALAARLRGASHRSLTLLDGDLVRQHLSSELGFSREHRDLNVTRIGFVAAEVTRHGGIAICAPIAPYAATRATVARMVGAVGRFVLVHVATPLAVCEQRDRKGLYAKARAGLISEFTGISDPYEVPEAPDVVIDTSAGTVADAASTVFDYLVAQQFIDLPRTTESRSAHI